MFWTSATDHWLVETMHDQETILAPNFLAENRRISNSSSGGALSKRSIPDSTFSLIIQAQLLQKILFLKFRYRDRYRVRNDFV